MFKDCTKEEIINIISEMRDKGAVSVTISEDTVSVQFNQLMMNGPAIPTDMDNALWDEFIKSQEEENN